MNNQSITSNISYTNVNNKNTGKLRIGIVNSEPFAYCEEKKDTTLKKDEPKKKDETEKKDEKQKEYVANGIAVKIWERVADKYNLNYEYICINLDDLTYDDIINDVSDDKYDVVLGDFTLASRRLSKVFFTRAYYLSEIKVFKKKTKTFLKNLLTNKFLILLFLIFFIIIITYTFILRHIKHISFFKAFVRVYKEFFTNEIYFLDSGIHNNTTKLINITWSLSRFTFFAVIITQLITIILDTNQEFISPQEFENVKEINVLAGTTYVDFVKKLGKIPILNDSHDEIMKKLINSDGNVYWLNETQKAIKLLGKYDIKYETTINQNFNDENSIIVNKNHPDLLEKIDLIITELQDNGELIKICKGYLPDRFDACLM
jgi:ABC-type amino acid transport substrate-binding protein